MLYRTIARLIQAGKVDGLAEKIDILFLNNRLVKEEYEALLEMLNEEDE